VSHLPGWEVGRKLRFTVVAAGPGGRTLSVGFDAVVVEAEERDEKEPRLIDSEVLTGVKRRPPYQLKYIGRDDYGRIDCWGGKSWTDDDPGCFAEPTERSPLTLIINEDMGAIREYRRYLTKQFTESEVERRINKYTSHVAFHLYQMYQASGRADAEAETGVDDRRRAEIQRVSMTLIKLMEVSR
jgi:hypothetical protein